MSKGKVYALSATEIAEQEYADKLSYQKFACRRLNEIIEMAAKSIAALEFPLDWPAKGYDLGSTLETLSDMRATQTEDEMIMELDLMEADRQWTASRNLGEPWFRP